MLQILLGYIKASTIQRISDKNIAVSNILSNPKLTATPDQNIIELLYIMRENGMSNIAVVTPNNELLGLITTSSLVTTLSTQFIGFEEEGDLI